MTGQLTNGSTCFQVDLPVVQDAQFMQMSMTLSNVCKSVVAIRPSPPFPRILFNILQHFTKILDTCRQTFLNQTTSVALSVNKFVIKPSASYEVDVLKAPNQVKWWKNRLLDLTVASFLHLSPPVSSCLLPCLLPLRFVSSFHHRLAFGEAFVRFLLLLCASFRPMVSVTVTGRRQSETVVKVSSVPFTVEYALHNRWPTK